MRDDDRILTLAAFAADGIAPDLSVNSDLAGEDAALLDELRILAAIAAANGINGGITPGVAVAPFERWGGLELVGVLGRGTSGTVYRARDPRLGRDVALKLFERADAEELTHEGRLLAKVRHPHVVAVYGADVCEGRTGIWMELVEGRTLEEIVTADGPFDMGEASLIVQDLCSATAAVHAAGLLHGDIKTQNAMLEVGGRPVLMDFSASRPHCAAGVADGTTFESRIDGTPSYLDPDVLSGSRRTQRSDIYSLGVLLFRLVTGRYPVEADTVDELRQRHEEGRRLRLRDLRPDLHSAFVDVVERALAPASQRFPSADTFRAALRQAARDPHLASVTDGHARTGRAVSARTLLAVLAVLALAATGWSWTTAEHPVESIAVLPFEEHSDAPLHDGLAEGLSSALVERLGRYRQIQIVTIPPDRGREVLASADPRVQLGVDGLLTGSFDRIGTSVTLDLRLIDARGAVRWRQRFVDPGQRLSRIVREAAAAVAAELNLGPSTDKRPAPALHPDAYRAYLRGRALWNRRTPENLRRARDAFEQAVVLEPHFAEAHAALADAYTLLQAFGVLPKADALPRARAAALEALKLDPDLAEAHTALAYVLHEERSYAAAASAYRRALALNPSYATAHHWYALTIVESRPGDAIAHIEQARKLSPLSDAIATDVGRVYLRAGRAHEAVASLERATAMNPTFLETRMALSEARAAAGDLDGAARELGAALTIDPASVSVRMHLIDVYSRAGQTEELRRVVFELGELSTTSFVPPQGLALAYACVGDSDAAFKWLAITARDGTSTRNFLDLPCFQRLAADPRFAPLRQSLPQGYTEPVSSKAADAGVQR